MIFMKKRITEQERIDREAADWVVKWEDRECEPAPKEQSRWFGWLVRSPRHVQSYFDVADLYDRLGGMDPGNKIDVDEWLAGRPAPVVAIGSTAPRSSQERRGTPSHGPYLKWATAAILIAALVGVSFWSVYESNSYRTTVGQQSINRLEDGSVVHLNTDSRVKISFSENRRTVELEGEALFSVAHDPARPFVVRTHDATVRAVGTQFNVYDEGGQTRVAVLEGAVQVTPRSVSRDAAAEHPRAALPSETIRGLALSAGEMAHVAQGRVSKESTPRIEAQVAWQQQKLVFEDATLSEVAAEFNRYNTAQLRIEGSVGHTKRLSGTFDALYPQSLLLYLQKDAAVVVEASGDDFIVRER